MRPIGERSARSFGRRRRNELDLTDTIDAALRVTLQEAASLSAEIREKYGVEFTPHALSQLPAQRCAYLAQQHRVNVVVMPSAVQKSAEAADGASRATPSFGRSARGSVRGQQDGASARLDDH